MLSAPLCARSRLNFQLILTHVSSLQIVIAASGSSSHAQERRYGESGGGSDGTAELRATEAWDGTEWFIVVCGINGPIHQQPFRYA